MTETTYVPAAPGTFAYHIEFARSPKESLLETTEGDILVDEYAGSLFATPIFAVRCSRGQKGCSICSLTTADCTCGANRLIAWPLTTSTMRRRAS
jgi:hypothetical protein